MAVVAHIDSGCVRIHYLQRRILIGDLLFQLFASLAAQLAALQSLKSRHLALCHGILSLFLNSARLGSVGNRFTASPTGSSPAFSAALATTQQIAATEIMLSVGHEGTKGLSIITAKPGCA